LKTRENQKLGNQKRAKSKTREIKKSEKLRTYNCKIEARYSNCE